MNSTETQTKTPADKIHLAERLHSPLIAWLVLFVSLAVTLAAYVFSKNVIQSRLRDNFDFRATEISQAIEDRLYIYEQMLRSGVALFYSTPAQNVTREQWRRFVTALDLDQHWPGIQGIGFSIPLAVAEKEAHELAIQAEGFTDYQIKPVEPRDEYSAIIYLEPFDWRNKRAFGYDMWSNDMRRQAMSRARDEGVAATSGIITLVQETSKDVQRGFLTYVPVYREGLVPSTLEERRSALLGWVYAPFRATDLMNGVLGSEDADLEFKIYDGTTLSQKSLLFSSSETNETSSTARVFEKSVSIELQGRPWTLVFKTPSEFALADNSNIPKFVAICGIIIDCLLFYVILSFQFINRSARKIAEQSMHRMYKAKEGLDQQVKERTESLTNIRDKLEENVELRTQELKEKVQAMEKMQKLTTGRELRIIELKQEINDLCAELNRPAPYDAAKRIER